LSQVEEYCPLFFQPHMTEVSPIVE